MPFCHNRGLIMSVMAWGWILAAAGVAAVVVLWRRNVVLSNKLYDVGMASVKSSSEFRSAALDFKIALDDVKKELIRRW